MTSDVDIWLAGSSWHYLGQTWRSRSSVKVYGLGRKTLLKWLVWP